MIKELKTEENIKLRQNSKVRIIDIRPVDYYNGWHNENQARGGHIKGAKSLPAKWANYIDWIEIVRHKNIDTEDQIIIYGDNETNIQLIAARFIKSGYKDVSVYYKFESEWLANPDLELAYLPRYKNLVSAQWVNQLINGEKPPEYDNNKYVLVHAHYRNREAYLSGHIPGAIDMDTLAVESPETWNRRYPEELKEAFEQHGIDADTTVVLYGKFMFPKNDDPFPGSAAGDIGAIRIAFIMMFAGVKDVRVLNGGFQSWKDEGFEISYYDEPKNIINDFGKIIPENPHLAVDTPEAKELIKSPKAELVCVRSYPEYIGEVSGYNYIEKKGRIPGAVFADCGSDAYHMENYRNLDHTTREFNEIVDNWKKDGITPDKHLAFYCGTGWRGSEAWFNAWLMGWPNVSVYDGGWFEWSNDPDNPTETGTPI
ncbi:MAG: rhodanese-like domain-containing protein [Bacteroidales bacterium]